MGSRIHLAVGRLEIDWSKNSGYQDHSALLQGEADTADVPYYYAADGREHDLGHTKQVIVIQASFPEVCTRVGVDDCRVLQDRNKVVAHLAPARVLELRVVFDDGRAQRALVWLDQFPKEVVDR